MLQRLRKKVARTRCCRPDGATVQHADLVTPFVNDRQIMRSTLLRGTHVISGFDICGSICHRATAKAGQQRQRTSLKVTLGTASDARWPRGVQGR